MFFIAFLRFSIFLDLSLERLSSSPLDSKEMLKDDSNDSLVFSGSMLIG